MSTFCTTICLKCFLTWKNRFGNILKGLRLEHKISQRKLGEILGVVNQTISFWETGSREPDLDMLVKIANYFNVNIDYLLGIGQI